MKFGATTVPSDIAGYGDNYQFHRPAKLGEDGEGNAIVAPYASVTWTFDRLTHSQYTWWRTTLLGGNLSVKFATCELYNDLRALVTYTGGCVVYAPPAAKMTNGLYRDVVIEIKYIR